MNEKSLNFTLQFLFYYHIFQISNNRSKYIINFCRKNSNTISNHSTTQKDKIFDFYPTIFYYLLKNYLIP